jgi:hypothetical protein
MTNVKGNGVSCSLLDTSLWTEPLASSVWLYENGARAAAYFGCSMPHAARHCGGNEMSGTESDGMNLCTADHLAFWHLPPLHL